MSWIKSIIFITKGDDAVKSHLLCIIHRFNFLNLESAPEYALDERI